MLCEVASLPPTSLSLPQSFCEAMHDSYVDIKMEQHYGLHHDQDFAGSHHMADVPDDHSPHRSPPNEYGDYSFTASSQVQLDSLYSRSMPPQFSSPQSVQPMISMPLWPSQITNPSENSPPPVVPLHRPILPMSKTAPVPILDPSPAPSKPAHTSSNSRRTLTDSDRRRMCEYHNDNPNVKQTEIGGKSSTQPSPESWLMYLEQQCLVLREGLSLEKACRRATQANHDRQHGLQSPEEQREISNPRRRFSITN